MPNITQAATSSNRNTMGTNVEAGMVARVGRAIRAAGEELGWFAPLNPPPISAPAGTEARQFDFPVGYNILINPRGDEPITWQQMRFVADGLDLVRLAIETVKDQMAKQDWEIRLKAKPGEKAADRKKLTATDPRVAKVRKVFESPDGEHDFAEWQRMILEEMCVTDSTSIVCDRSYGGDPLAFRLIDGTTITRKITINGTTPRPDAEAPHNIAYQQIIKGVPAVDFTTAELLYKMRNPRVWKIYGFSPVEQVIFISNLALRRGMFKLSYYTDGNLPEAFIPVGEDWSAQQIEAMQAKFDARNAGDLAQRRRAQFIPKLGGTITFPKEALLKDEMDEWIARIICYAFSLPPTAFVKQMNRATGEQAQESADDEGVEPRKRWLLSLYNKIIRDFLGFDDIEFAWMDERTVAPKDQAVIDASYVGAGIKSRAEIRERMGEDAYPGSERYTITTASGIVPVENAIENSDNPPEPPPTGAPGDPQVTPPGKTPVQAKGAIGAKGKDPKAAAKRNAMAAKLMDVYEDLNPELRDPVIVAKLAKHEHEHGAY